MIHHRPITHKDIYLPFLGFVVVNNRTFINFFLFFTFFLLIIQVCKFIKIFFYFHFSIMIISFEEMFTLALYMATISMMLNFTKCYFVSNFCFVRCEALHGIYDVVMLDII